MVIYMEYAAFTQFDIPHCAPTFSLFPGRAFSCNYALFYPVHLFLWRFSMKYVNVKPTGYIVTALFTLLFLTFAAGSAMSSEYKALNGVNKYRAVYEVSLGSPKLLPLVFWAVRNSYDADVVKALPEKPEIAVVFHGPVVKLITSNREGFSKEEAAALDEFAEMIRQMKAEGVTFEVCLYAAKVLGVDPATIYPEIDRVGNGFISVIGYQEQGYGVVRIP